MLKTQHALHFPRSAIHHAGLPYPTTHRTACHAPAPPPVGARCPPLAGAGSARRWPGAALHGRVPAPARAALWRRLRDGSQWACWGRGRAPQGGRKVWGKGDAALPCPSHCCNPTAAASPLTLSLHVLLAHAPQRLPHALAHGVLLPRCCRHPRLFRRRRRAGSHCGAHSPPAAPQQPGEHRRVVEGRVTGTQSWRLHRPLSRTTPAPCLCALHSAPVH